MFKIKRSDCSNEQLNAYKGYSIASLYQLNGKKVRDLNLQFITSVFIFMKKLVRIKVRKMTPPQKLNRIFCKFFKNLDSIKNVRNLKKTSAALYYRDIYPKNLQNYVRPKNAYTMLQNSELCYLEDYGGNEYRGSGKIVVLGCWFGGDAIAIASGLLRNPKRKKFYPIIEAYDIFIWWDWMQIHTDNSPGKYKKGDSFFDEVKGLMKPYDKLVRLHQVDLEKDTSFTDPIELLFIDAWKSMSIANNTTKCFFPHLINNSIVVHEDFGFFSSSIAPVHLIMWYLRTYFEYIGHIHDSCSVVFRLKKCIAMSDIPEFTVDFFTIEQIQNAYDWAVECVSDEFKLFVVMAKINYCIEHGFDDSALQELRKMVKSGHLIGSNVMRDYYFSISKRKNKEPIPEEIDRLIHSLVRDNWVFAKNGEEFI